MSDRLIQLVAMVAICAIAAADDTLGPKGRAGIRAVDRGYAADAIAFLEDAAEETPSNPKIYEYLAISYLAGTGGVTSREMRKKAGVAMRKAIDLGGEASVPVDVANREDKGVLGSKGMLNVERGMLRISRGLLRYDPKPRPEGERQPTVAAVSLRGPDIRSFGPSKQSPSTGTFELVTPAKKYVFRTANFSPDEAEMIFGLIADYVK